jgi:integrase
MSSEFKGTPMKDLRGYLKPEEIERIFNKITSQRDKVLFRLLWVTGARISEIVGDKTDVYLRKQNPHVFYGLRVDDIITDENTVLLDTLKRKRYPPEKRRVAIDRKTIVMLQDYIKAEGSGQSDKVFRISRVRVYQLLRRYGEEAGVKKVGKKPIHPHGFRHSHCVAYVRKNNTLEGLRKLQNRLKHANIETTAHYLQFAPEEQKEIEEIFGETER